ncbi:DUF637 domain-containing protein [Halopseudomonas nanhaiensis]|uniref:two-partner secretion domain-containing protein n=1 Tax=Halopseudomonas nanhaiensis TaxID=2830842 RepID=UPI001CC097D7|nr:DUF637 domain-containing protein [Halopseudomonas nanhaiensis]UAW98214.1 DUF637 domain-containing protein [Halopseudomonas nanhaiensis]
MDTRSPLFQNVAAILVGVLFINPVVAMGADLALDAAAGGNASLGQAGNGVPVVNIATPSSAGLSHNRFNEYNVGQQGLILNNATGATNSTQLGGIILGNPNLSGGAAGLILNEVTGANPSNLRGYTEVAGQRAGVIVANPHGITCDGCGFINTPRVTLSTGKPIIEQGALRQFDVDGGAIRIEGAGLNASNVDRFDLITRSAQINANLHANQLNIVTGRNQVDADSLAATAKADDGSDKPALALDSSALGGMYAGAIQLIGTEQGVGVRLAGDMAAHAGDIHIDANGNLSMARTAAAGDVRIAANQVDLTADTYAEGQASVKAREALTVHDSLAAAGAVQLAADTVVNRGVIEAGVAAGGTSNFSSDLNVSANNLVNEGSLLASGSAAIQASGTLDNRQGTVAADDLQISAAALLNADGRVLADTQLAVRASQLDNQQGVMHSGQTAKLNVANTLDNRGGDIIAMGEMQLSAGALDNSTNGWVASAGAARVESATITNQNGEISSQQSLALIAGQMNNGEGRVIAGTSLDAQVSQLDNRAGLISGMAGIALVGDNLDNSSQGTLSSREGAVSVTLSGKLDNHSEGAVVSAGAQQLQVGSIDNGAGGILSSQSNLSIVAQQTLDNSVGVISAGSGLTIDASELINQDGQMQSAGPFALTAASLDNRTGQLASGGTLTVRLTNALFNNAGQLTAAGPLRIEATRIDNSNGYLASNQLLNLFGVDLLNMGGSIVATDAFAVNMSGTLDNSGTGLLLSRNATVTLDAGEVRNGAGTVQAASDVVVNTAGALDNRGGQLIAQGDLEVNAAQLNNSNNGLLSAASGWLTARISGAVSNIAGVLQAESVNLNAGVVDNSQGRITALAGDASIQAGSLTNRQGNLLASGNLALDSTLLDNNLGRIGAQYIELSASDLLNVNGLIESDSHLVLNTGTLDNRNGSLRALGQTGTTSIITRSTLDNRSGTIESANTDLRLNLGGLLNAGGTARHVGTGRLDVASQTVTQAGGSLITHGDLTLDAAEWIHEGLLQAANLTLNVGRFTQNQTGRIIASDSLVATGGHWTNHGLLTSDGTLDLRLTGTYNGTGTLSSLGDMSFAAHTVDLASAGRTGAGGNATVSITHALTNHGRLTAGQDLSLTTGSLYNYGTLGAGEDVRLQAASLLNQGGLLFSGSDMHLRGNALTNLRGDIYSLGDLSFAANDAGALAGRFSNLSGTVESQGNLSIAASFLENARETLDIVTEKVSARLIYLGCGDCGGTKESSYFDLEEVDRTSATRVSPQAQLLAGQSMRLHSDVLENRYSLLASGANLRIDTGTLLNKGAQTGDVTTVRKLSAYRVYQRYVDARRAESNEFNDRNWIDSPTYAPNDITADIDYFFRHISLDEGIREPVYTNRVDYHATIQAAGDVTINAAERIDNSVIRPGFAYTSGGNRTQSTNPGTGQATYVVLNPHLPPDLQQQQVDPLSLPGFSLPQGENGLFRLSGQSGQAPNQPGAVPNQGAIVTPGNTAPAQRYLIETNPALTDLRQFLGSDYMLARLGGNPDDTLMRLGDGLYEQRLVREAIVARTGQRFLAGMTSDEAMYRYLMDNAIASKDSLQLSLGVALTAEQVAALTHDIVWMEEREVMGQRVLVPVLYLAQAEGRLAPNGALIQGRDVALISGGELRNQGTLRASRDLAASAQNLDNRGLLQAHERVQLLALDSIRNSAGGIIAGREVSATALTGDIINERSVATHQSERGERAMHRQDFLDSSARIEASGDLALNAGRDLLNIGGAMSAGGNAELSAGRDLLIASQRTEEATRLRDRRSTLDQQIITQHAGELQVGGNASLQTGRDLAVVGSKVEAGGDVLLQAGGDLTLAAAANESHFEYHRDGGGKKIDAVRTDIVQQAAEIKAGGSVVAVSGGDTNLVASHISAGDEAYVYAGGDLNLLAADDLHYSLYDKQSKGSWGRKETRRDEVTDVRSVGSSISAGSDVTLISEGSQRYQGARLESGADITLDSGGTVTFEAVKDLHQESHEKSKSDWAWNSAKGKGTTDETLRQSQLIAQGNLAIRAAEGVQIDIKEIDQNTVSRTIDAMVQADPDLAWLKEMEARGDVDWQTVKEVHDSFEYSHSGLGVGAQLVIAIAVAAIVGPAVSGMAGGGGMGAAAGAAASGAATTASVSFINNRGDLGAVFKDVTSSDAIKGYATSALTAGVTAGYLDQAFGVETDFINHTTKGFKIGTIGGAAKFGSHLAAQGAIQAGSQTLINGGSFSENLEAALTAQVYHLAQAIAFNAVGDVARSQNFAEGGLEKTALHALTGGLISKAMGQDFATGALAAGANEALVEKLSRYVELNNGLEQAASQIVGTVAAGVTGGDVHHGADLAKNATAYNRQLHFEEKALARKLAERSEGRFTVEQIEDQLRIAAINGTDINASTDMLAAEDGIYDFDGNWRPIGDKYVQLFGDANRDVIAYIKEHTDTYAWTPSVEFGYTPDPRYSGIPRGGDAPRDRLTGYVLDEDGGYRVSVVIEGTSHSPRFRSCGDAECLAVGANIDFSDPATKRWIQAVDAQTADKLGKAFAASAIVGPSSLAVGSTGLGIVAAYLKGDSAGAVGAAVLAEGFNRYAVARGLTPSQATKLSSAIDLAGGWQKLVEVGRE